MPTPINKSYIKARRFSESVIPAVFILAALKSWRLMQSELAGPATLSAT